MRRATSSLLSTSFSFRVSIHARHATGDPHYAITLEGRVVSIHARHATGDRIG